MPFNIFCLTLLFTSSLLAEPAMKQERTLDLASLPKIETIASEETVTRSPRYEEERISLALELAAGISSNGTSLLGTWSSEASSPTFGVNVDFRYGDFGLELRTLVQDSNSSSTQSDFVEAGVETQEIVTSQSLMAGEISMKYQPTFTNGSTKFSPKVGLGYNAQSFQMSHAYTSGVGSSNVGPREVTKTASNSANLTSNGFHALIGLDVLVSPTFILSAETRFKLTQSGDLRSQSDQQNSGLRQDSQSGRARIGFKFRLDSGVYVGGDYQSLFFNQDDLLGAGPSSYLGTLSYRF